MATKRKHRKRQMLILVSFRIFISSLWHCKQWPDGWANIHIGRNHTDMDISVLLVDEYSQHPMIIDQFQATLYFYIFIPEKVRKLFIFRSCRERISGYNGLTSIIINYCNQKITLYCLHPLQTTLGQCVSLPDLPPRKHKESHFSKN